MDLSNPQLKSSVINNLCCLQERTRDYGWFEQCYAALSIRGYEFDHSKVKVIHFCNEDKNKDEKNTIFRDYQTSVRYEEVGEVDISC